MSAKSILCFNVNIGILILFASLIQSRSRDLLLDYSRRSSASELAPATPCAVDFHEVHFDEDNATRPTSPTFEIPVGVIEAIAYGRYPWGLGRDIAVHDITDNTTISEILESVRYNLPAIRLASSAVMIIFRRKRRDFWQDIDVEFDIHYDRRSYHAIRPAKTFHIESTRFGDVLPEEELLQPQTRIASLLGYYEARSKRHYYTRIRAIVNS